MLKNTFFVFTLLILSLMSILISTYFGEIPINLSLFFQPQSETTAIYSDLILEIRLPRALCAFTTGGLLALAGALLQVMLHNPLADPYILGATGGAAVVSVLLLFLGMSGYWLNGGALLGAVFAMGVVFWVGRGKNWSSLRMILTGVVMGSLWGAIISLLITLSIDKNLPPMLFWLMGDLSYAPSPTFGLLLLAIGLLWSFIQANKLNVLTRGLLQAQSLGVNTRSLYWQFYFLSALLTACAVSMAGCIGFIGLIVPHFLRLLGQTNYRILLPASALLGGTLLTLCDTLARVIASPLQLPVGAITALIGAPFFIYLLLQNKSL